VHDFCSVRSEIFIALRTSPNPNPEVRLEILDYKYRAPNGAQASIKLLTHVLA